MHKVPTSVKLPGGYEIKVTRLTTKKANEEMGSEVFAQWDVEDHEILLRKDRKGKDLLEDFVHEMEHAIVDWKDWFLGKSEQP